ncbi:PREDICTED: DENN domain-containing protein 3, partial [Myotis davidii]|uniref:DENN domain-containing protein 3 n=1 Tax=Myotis davidii TaxID=225400 RepID=UPI000767B7AA
MLSPRQCRCPRCTRGPKGRPGRGQTPSRTSSFCLLQVAQRRGHPSPALEPEVLSVFVPPFVSKEDGQAAGTSCGTLGRTKRRSFRKKREKPRADPGLGPAGPRETDTEDISVPDGVDLLALPQLCFPGGLCVAWEPQEDRVHFLVLTDVSGNRTYAAVAQYYRPLHDEHCFYSGKPPRESGLSVGAAGCFVPFAVCVISRFPYYNALRDCLSCLLTHLKPCKDFEVDNHIRDFAAKVSLIPSPPPGPLHLVISPVSLQTEMVTRGRAHRWAWQQRLNRQIQQLTLQLLVSIFREVKSHLNYEHRVFNSEEFLKTRAPGDQRFYKQVKSHLNYEHRVFNSEEFLKTRAPGDQRFYKQMLIFLFKNFSIHCCAHYLQIAPFGGHPGGFCFGKWSRETQAEAAPGSGFAGVTASAAGLSPQILACLLTEQRLVFFSASWALLTLVAECFLAYLHPLRWQHTLVPILSGQMLDFLMAPTAFLMGCHLSHLEEVSKEADGLVLINIDSGSVTCSGSDIPDIPLLAAQTFIQRRLFEALTVGQQKLIDPETFRDFYTCWKETEAQAQEVSLPAAVTEHLDKNECVYKLSGSGRNVRASRGLSAVSPQDPQYVQQALTHALLMDAVVGALQTPGAIYAASKLSYFDKMRREMPAAVPKTTAETLKHKINPSAGETFPQAVDVLLYTPGHLDPAERVGDARPKLWCALQAGRVMVFDASSWSLHQHCVRVGSSALNCMAMVAQGQVWVGSEDSVIYIISVHSMSCHKQLTEHRASVTGFVVQNGPDAPSQVYSCSVDGAVLAWDVSTLQVTRRLQLPGSGLSSIQLHADCLWCCTGNSIMAVNSCVRQELRIDE